MSILEESQQTINAPNAPGVRGQQRALDDDVGSNLPLLALVCHVDDDISRAYSRQGNIIEIKENGDCEREGRQQSENQTKAYGQFAEHDQNA